MIKFGDWDSDVAQKQAGTAEWGSVSVKSWRSYRAWWAAEQRSRRVVILSTPTGTSSFYKLFEQMRKEICEQMAVPKELLCKEAWSISHYAKRCGA